MLAVSSCPRHQLETDDSAESLLKPPSSYSTGNASEKGMRPVRLYFYDRQATVLVPVTRLVDDKLEYPAVIFEEMIRGPKDDKELARTIHTGTKLNAAIVTDGVLTVDFSKDVLGYGGGSVSELGLVLSLEHVAKQINGVNSIQILIDGEKLDYLPEGTGVKTPIPLEPFVNNFDPADDETKVEMYLILKGSQYLVPAAISAVNAAGICEKLKDPLTYGGFFDDCLLSVNFEIVEDTDKKAITVVLDDTLLELPAEKRAIAVKSIVYSVYSFVETRQEYDGSQVTYNGDEIVALLDVDLTKDGIARDISLINKEGKI